MENKDEIETPKTRIIRRTYYVLLGVAAAILLLFIIGTIAGLIRKLDTPLISFGKNTSAQLPAELPQEGDIRVFSGIGRLRIPLANDGVLILSIAFPYLASDIDFTEELAGKISEFKTTAVNYFSNLPQEELAQINEDKAKADILAQYNAILRLGRITTLYFNDMMMLDAN